MKAKLSGHRNRRQAFSLVEVAAALGIFAFAMVATLSLLSVSLNSDQKAGHDSTLARMAESTISRLRSKGFVEIQTNSAYAPGTSPQFFYDSNGELIADANGLPVRTATDASLYSCTLTRQASASPNLLYLHLEFRWPVTAPPDRQDLQVVNASFANPR